MSIKYNISQIHLIMEAL